MIIHTALFAEAKPIIKFFALKPVDDNFFKIFSNEDKILIISGIGKINSALALSRIFTLYPHQNILLSIGVAAAKKEFKIGELVNVKKIIDVEEKSVFHLKESFIFKNASLATSSFQQKNPKADLGDMEASSIYKAAKKYKKDLMILKIISDHFEPEKVKKSDIENLILKNLNKLSDILSNNLISQK